MICRNIGPCASLRRSRPPWVTHLVTRLLGLRRPEERRRRSVDMATAVPACLPAFLEGFFFNPSPPPSFPGALAGEGGATTGLDRPPVVVM